MGKDTNTGRVTLRTVNGALLDVPVFETHERGNNWMAVVDVDPALPGGLSREFVLRGRGDCFYSVSGVALFDPVEFGADYTTSMGKKRPSRWYGIVVALTEDAMVLENCESGTEAVVRSRAAKVSAVDRVNALKAELACHEAKAERLRLEIEAASA